MQHQTPYDLPADAESIRTNIIDSQFSCDEKDPGYYADVENECQVRFLLITVFITYFYLHSDFS
jgi:hypothetical protein